MRAATKQGRNTHTHPHHSAPSVPVPARTHAPSFWSAWPSVPGRPAAAGPARPACRTPAPSCACGSAPREATAAPGPSGSPAGSGRAGAPAETAPWRRNTDPASVEAGRNHICKKFFKTRVVHAKKKKPSTSANPSRKCGKMMAGALITSHSQNNILLAESQRPWGSRTAVRQTRRHWTHQGQPCPHPRWNPHNHASFNYKSTPCCMKSSLASTEWKVLHNGVSNVAIPAAALSWPSTRVFIARQIGCYSGNIFEQSNRRLVPPGCQRANSHALTPSARAVA